MTDPYKLLRDKARQHRDRSIYAARAEYNQTIKHLEALCRLLGAGGFQRLGNPLPINESLKDMKAIAAAEIVLLEIQPATLPEIVVAMQARGCRSLDDPRRVKHSVRSAMVYRADKFTRDSDGRWSVVV